MYYGMDDLPGSRRSTGGAGGWTHDSTCKQSGIPVSLD